MIHYLILLIAIVAATASSAWGAIDDWTVPQSAWLEEEKQVARLALAGTPSTLLIVPTQGPENRFDPVERSLMTALMRAALLDHGSLAAPDTDFVRRALGRNLAQYPLEQVMALAELVQAQQVLISVAEHDRNGSFDLRVQLLDAKTGQQIRARNWQGLPYSDPEPPSVAVAALSDEVVAFVTDTPVEPLDREAFTLGDDFRFPKSADDLIERALESPLHSAAYLQFLGMLHPEGAFDGSRNRLFERSLVELGRVSADSPERRYFVARAYAYLDRRPAAMRALGEPVTLYEKALLDALNGNLTSLRERVRGLGISPLDMFVWRDLYIIESIYTAPEARPAVARFVRQYPLWATTIDRALRNTGDWNNSSAVDTKAAIDMLLPESKPWLDDAWHLIRDWYAAPPDTAHVERLADQLRAFEIEHAASVSQAAGPRISVTKLDLIDLARATLVADHLERISEDLWTRQLPRRVIERIDAAEAVFAGHPEVELFRGEALSALATEATDLTEKTKLQREWHTAGRNGLMWTDELTYLAIGVAGSTGLFFMDPERYQHYKSGVGYAPDEYPYRYFEWPAGSNWYYVMSPRQVEAGALERCLAYTWTSFGCLKLKVELAAQASDRPLEVARDLMSTYSGRFAGHPQIPELQMELDRAYGATDAVTERMTELVDSRSEEWSVYYSLGRALKREGRYDEAQRAVLRYPAFRNPGRGESVAVSNYANTAGSWFFWIGETELAEPLLKISVETRSGSDAYYSAGARLGFIAGDLEMAEEFTTARAQRYGSEFAFRDLMQLLHLRGESESAWQLFDLVQADNNAPQLWSGAFVGHRKAGATTAEIIDWIKGSRKRLRAEHRIDTPYKIVNLAPRYLLLTGIHDRAPGSELADGLAAINVKGKAVYYEKRTVSFDMVTHYHDELISTPPRGQTRKQFDNLPTPYEWFATAMAALLSGDNPAAFNAFNEMGYYYRLDEFLPYYAFSAAAVGKSNHLWPALAAREPELDKTRRSESASSAILGHRFNEDLTYAVLHAFKGEHEIAMKYLRNAFSDQPFIDERAIYPYYQVVDIADRLYEALGREEYRNLALDLARRHVQIQPMYAWAYFVVARHSTDDAERMRMASAGFALDPHSQRGSLLPEALRTAPAP